MFRTITKHILKEQNKNLIAENLLLKEQILKQEAIINKQALKIDELETRLNHLENIQSKDSTNSSKPPSTDGFKRTVSMRSKSGKSVGGQKGHPGHYHPMVEKANRYEIHSVSKCSGCGQDISTTGVLEYQRRQVIDIPPIIIAVTEHQAEVKCCPHCQKMNTASFPTSVKQPVQYGPNIRSQVIYMLNFLLLPVGRTAKCLHDFFGIDISEGTLVNIQKECADNLDVFESNLKACLQRQPVLHFDETGYYIANLRQWLHVACTKELTLYMPHQKRGKEAMDAMGILPNYEGIAVHDYWKSYMEYSCSHILCNAHHLRDLNFCAVLEESEWAVLMIGFLFTIKDLVDESKNKSLTCLKTEQIEEAEQQYDLLIHLGKEQNPLPVKQAGKRGQTKKSKTLNMVIRFDEHRKSVLGFMYDFLIPFDNNQAEQDIRMTKVKLKVSGCFRSMEGAEAFALIRSYISTIRKQGKDLIKAILSAVNGNPLMPEMFNSPSVQSG